MPKKYQNLGKNPDGKRAQYRVALNKRHSRPPTISQALSTSLEEAVRGLRNNEVRLTVEFKAPNGKASTETKISYPPELVAAFRGLFGSRKQYLFQMHQVLDVVSSSGGGTLGFVAISPSVASYGEWSSLSALFDEAKAVRSSIAWHSAYVASSATDAGAVPTLAMAMDEQNLNADPGSTLSVYRLAESKTWSSNLGPGGSGVQRQAHTFASRSWVATATPFSVSPIGGFIGCWVYGNDGLFANTVTVAHVFSITVGRFRCRA